MCAEACLIRASALTSSGARVSPLIGPADEEHAPIWHRLAGNRPMLTFALTGQADVTCHAEWTHEAPGRSCFPTPGAARLPSLGGAVLRCCQTPAGAVTLQLQVAGWHNVKNALAASACALAAGCPLDAIGRGLESFAPVKGARRSSALSVRTGDRERR